MNAQAHPTVIGHRLLGISASISNETTLIRTENGNAKTCLHRVTGRKRG